ncbi:glutamine synthetase family protein [Baekduia soli]|nr:glutamine synthetase family protein [Baekduia soli]
MARPVIGRRPTAEEVLASLGDVRRVRVETPDLNGALRGKYVAVEKLRSGKPVALPEVYLALDVDEDLVPAPVSEERTGYPDILIAPDWSTARAMPHEPGVVAVVGDGLTKAGDRHPQHPRSVLRNVIDRAAGHGYEAVFGVEYEFWAFRDGAESDAARRVGDLSGMTPLSYTRQGYSMLRWADHAAFADDLEASSQAYGVPIETLMTEIGNGQLEAALAPAPALEAADMAARFKLLVRDVARRHGMYITFMAKLVPEQQGTSGHLHQSLLRDGRNAFWDGAPGRLSAAGLGYAAGLLRATRDCAAFFAPYPNSYRRYVPGHWAPLQLSWGWDDRNSAVRAITLSASATRFEQRRSGSDLQPYLAIAACIAGGVDGILAQRDPGPPGEPLTSMPLPADLRAAAALLRGSALARDWLGDELVELYAASRDDEQRVYDQLARAHIPAWEIRRYFEVV